MEKVNKKLLRPEKTENFQVSLKRKSSTSDSGNKQKEKINL